MSPLDRLVSPLPPETESQRLQSTTIESSRPDPDSTGGDERPGLSCGCQYLSVSENTHSDRVHAVFVEGAGMML